MRKTLLFLLLLSVKLTFGQFRDDFSDGDFTVNPSWSGQTSLFTITANKQLKSSLSSVAQVISLATKSALALNVKWEFSIQLNFDPSTTNFSRIYLIADQEDLKGNLNGYFIQIGENGSTDSYDLYKQTGSAISKIIDGLPKNRANINFLSTKLRITRDEFGKWEVYTAIDGATNYILEGSIIDLNHISTAWFGVYCRYTATRSDGFVFDDFNVEELVPDVTPPQLLSIKIIDEFDIEATFSEAVQSSTALLTTNYIVKELNDHPISISLTAVPNVMKLLFSRPFRSGKYTMIATKIKDLRGNEILDKNEASTFYIQPYSALKGDIVINEIFADPSPQIGLPAAEFVELWNTTDQYIILKDWKFKDLTSNATLLVDTLAPKSYLILCAKADTSLFKPFAKTMGLSPWPSLNNDKDRLSLFNPQNELIDEVFYTDDWYKDNVKRNGGYSLELIDPKNKCIGIQNWQASKHALGGTPGAINSVYQLQLDSVSPRMMSASILNQNTIRVDFNKSIDSTSAALVTNYHINNGIGIPLSAVPQLPDFKSVLLTFQTALTKGLEHTLTASAITDCGNNIIDQNENSAKIFIAKDAIKGDLLISEILFNPRTGGVDFVEIYNHANHILDLSAIQLANVDENGNPSNLKKISLSSAFIPSKSYWVLTSNFEIIKAHYKVENDNNFTKMSALPAFNTDKGTVVLVSGSELIDRFDYTEKMHLPLLQIKKGVSLERSSFEKPANEKGNFTSAAQSSGFATPTYKNSQSENSESPNQVWLITKTFSPDGDGFEDELKIDFQFVNPRLLATVNIYGLNGILIKKLIANISIGNRGSFSWNGLDDSGQLNKVGIYVVKFDVFGLNGRVKSYKLACVLAAKL